MSFDTWLIYLGTVLVFMSTPGPSHVLMLSNSIGNGFKKSTATAAGDLSANFLQMLAASIGLAGILAEHHGYFVAVKWFGVAYLVLLGLKLVFSKSSNMSSMVTQQRSAKSLYWQGFITSAANPKAVFFFAALFPQFILSNDPLLPQFIILSVTYLVVDGLFLCFYGKFADTLLRGFGSALSRYLNQITGTLFIGAAILLGFKELEKH